VKWLTKERGAKVIGTDAPTVGSSSSDRDPAQGAVATAGAWSLVCLDALDTLPPRGAWILIGALPIVGASGAPARVVALVPPDTTEVSAPATPAPPADAPTPAPEKPPAVTQPKP
jgi:kynurenine formamidase